MTAASRPTAVSRRRRVLAIIIAAFVVAITGLLAWAASPMTAESGPLAAVRADADITYSETADGVVLAPADPNGTGLVYIAGARVEPAAYASKLSGLVDAGVTVVIARPTLNFAIFDTRPLTAFEALAPGIDRWFVGGHSLGGVKACLYAADDPDAVAGLILFGSYCSADISDTDLPVLTIEGTEDGLSTPEKIADAADLLPASAELVTLEGAAHAQFGDYGAQPGDGTPTATDDDVRAALTEALISFTGAD